MQGASSFYRGEGGGEGRGREREIAGILN